ncbi:amino acid adenylation domain-containing protein, partial [Edaphovirga cremea]|uniref:amino acid adenylation domain-containing protein n=1 Tax=Edaphovirga cremea TaxID=2267246 RepID=UPI003989DD26
IKAMEVEAGTAKVDLLMAIAAQETGGGLRGVIEYDTDLFEAASIKRMVGHYQKLLQELVRDGERAVGAVPMLGAEERQQLLLEWNQTSAPVPGSCLHQLFEEQVERTPDAVAVIFEEQQLSYGELNQRVNQLAHHLRRMGVGPEVLVGVLMERSAEMLIGMLGILKAGGAYVPLDPNYPQERLSFMLEDAEAKVLLTQERLRDRLPEWQAEIICVDSDWELIAAESSDDPLPLNVPGNLAYLIYTSGSTGRPKGVSIEHRNAVTLLHWAKDVYTPAEYAGVLASTSICFDLSVFELFVPLSWGGKVIIAENALQLPLLPAAQEVTLINTVPSAMAELARDGGLPASVRVVNLAGEPLKRTLVNAVYRLEGVEKVFNLYGPSEDTTYSTFVLVPDGDGGVPIGRPVTNTGVYLLNEQMQLVPAGVSAQLYIGGEGLARGYHRRPELTAEQFVPNPFSAEPGARLYRTGDVARYLANGELDYLGRVDHQVKIRGFRVEVGEVETVLEQHEAIKQAVVAVWEAEAGGKRLVAYVVSGQSEAPATAELRAFLKQRLPDYMVPAAFIFLSELPLTASGKVNRRALPEPEPCRPELSESYVGARTETEALVCALWGQILKLERVGIYDNFFELGGHSLLATQLMSQVRKAFGVEIPLRLLFEQPTVAGLTRSIEAELSGGRNSASPMQRLSREGPQPLSFAQQRLWFLDQFTPGSVTYNMPIAMRLSGSLHFLALQQTFSEILRRHEVLRTSFAVIDGAPVQLVSEPRDFDLPVIDLSQLERRESEQQVQRLASEEAHRPFDFTQAPLFRATLLRLDAAEHVLLLTMHHIISDGWSMGVLIKEVTTLYEAFSAGQPSPLAELPVQYGDFAAWQREQLQEDRLEEQLQYWREQLQDAPVLLELPTENPRPPVQSYRGAELRLEITPQTLRALKVLSQQHGVTLLMTLLAAIQVLLYRYTGQDDIVVGTPVAGRTRAETEGLIGFFLNTLALRVSLKGDPTFAALLSRVREACLGAYAHQDVP